MNFSISKLVKPFVLLAAIFAGTGQNAIAQEGGVNLGLEYSQPLVEIGETVTLTYTINSETSASAIGFTDTFPAGLTVSPAIATEVPGTFCGNFTQSITVTATELVVTGVSLFANFDCKYTLDFVGASAGVQMGVVSGTTSDLGALTVSNASVEVDVPFAGTGQISLGKEFTNDPVIAGSATILEFTLLNSDEVNAATNFTFTDDLNAMLAGATFDGSVISDTCGGTISGGATATYVGGTVPARSNCKVSISVDIPSGAATGLYTNTTTAPSAMLNGSAVNDLVATDRLQVIALEGVQPLTVSHNISGDLTPGGSLIFNYTISNSNASAATTVSLAEIYGQDIPGLTFGSVTGDCGAGSSITNGDASEFNQDYPAVVLSAGTIAAMDSCSFSVTMVLPNAFNTGTYDFTVQDIFASVDSVLVETDPVTASAVLTGSIDLTVVPAFASAYGAVGGQVALSYLVKNSSDADTATAISFNSVLSAVSGTQFHAGSSYASLVSDSCGGAVGGTTTLQYTGGSLAAGGECVISVLINLGPGASASQTLHVSNLLAGINGGTPIDLTGNATASLEILDYSLPTFTASVSPTTYLPGQSGVVTYTFDNTQADSTIVDIPLVNITFPSGLTGGGTLLSNTCGVDPTVLVSGSSHFLLGLPTLGAGTSCSVSYAMNVSGGILDGDFPLGFNIQWQIAGLPFQADAAAVVSVATDFVGFSKSFSAPSIEAGGTVNAIFTATNTSTLFDVSIVGFSDNLNDFLTNTVASSVVSTTCGGSVDIVSNSSVITLITDSPTDAVLVAGGSCTITVAIDIDAGAAPAVYTNTTSIFETVYTGPAVVGEEVQAEEVPVNAPAASADLTILAVDGPVFTMGISPAAIAATEATVVTYTITNPSGSTISALNFTNNIGGSLGGATIASINQNACTATVAGSGTGFLTVSGISIDAGSSCVLVVGVQSVITPDGMYLNTTSDLTSNGLRVADAASASLDITFALPSIAKVFNLATMQEGQTATMTLTLGNSGMPIAATGVNLTDTFPTGMTLATPSNASTTCTGGTLTAVAGGGSVSYSGGTIPASGTCMITADVTSVIAANYFNQTGDMTTVFGNSGTASALLEVTDTPEPTFSKAFGVATMPEGDTTSLTLTLSNVDSFLDAESVDFTDTFPSGLLVVTPTDAATTCTGGTLTATAGSGAVSYTGGEISAGGSCTVTVTVTSVLDNTYVNTTGDLTSSLGNSGTASDSLIVTPAPVMDFNKAFGVSAMEQGDTTLLTLTLDNSGALIPATSVDFTDTFPSGITVVTPSDAATTCTGGTLTAVAGSGSVAYTGGTVAAEATCTVTVTTTSVLVNNYVNLTGDLTSSLGNSSTATDSINITPAPIPTIAKAFAVAAMPQGDVTTLTLTLANTDALIDAEEVDVVDTFPTGMFIADPANASTTCTDGTLTAAVGAGVVSYADGTVPTGATCTITVDVTSVATGDLVNLTDAMMSTLGDSGTATATLEITAAPIPTFVKSFSVSSMTQGEVATLTLTMANTGALIDAEDVTMNDPFPTGLIVATPPNASTTCTDGTLSADADATSVSYTDGTIDAGESCTIVVDVTSVAIGELVNLTDALSTSLGDSGTATAMIEMIAAPIPTFVKSFSPTSIEIDSVSTMSFDISSSAFIDATAITFRDVFPTGMVIADTPNATSSCGGSVTALAASGSMGFGSGELDAMGDCVITVDVVGVASGDLVNTTDDMTSSLGNSGTGIATLTVAAATTGTVTIVQVSDQEDTFNFASSEALLSFSILTTSGAGSYGPVTLEAGTYNLTQSRPAGYANTGLECDDTNSVGVLGSGALTINLEAGENLTCTYVSVDSSVISETINAFLERRITLILGSEPSSSRRMARLNQIYGASRSVSFAQGNLKSLLPFTLKTAGLEDGNVSFSTSMSQARDALARQDLSLDGSATRTAKVGNERADFWIEFQHKKYSDADGIEGKFTIGYAGVDYLLNPNVLIGGMFQYDKTSESSAILSTTANGRGWMVGPYVTARLSPTLFFDGRLAYGESSNTASTGLIGPVDFTTNRFLVDASLIGDFKAKNWRIQPNASLAYMQEIWSIDPSTGAKGETVSQGEFKFGPQFSTSIANDNGVIFSPKFGFDGVYSFGRDASTATSSNLKGWRARANAGFGLVFPSGASVELNATYDGIGEDDFEAYGAQISFSVPLRQQ